MKRLYKEQDPAKRCLDIIIMTKVVILLSRLELE